MTVVFLYNITSCLKLSIESYSDYQSVATVVKHGQYHAGLL